MDVRKCNVSTCGLSATQGVKLQWRRGEGWSAVRRLFYCDDHTESLAKNYNRLPNARAEVFQPIWR